MAEKLRWILVGYYFCLNCFIYTKYKREVALDHDLEYSIRILFCLHRNFYIYLGLYIA